MMRKQDSLGLKSCKQVDKQCLGPYVNNVKIGNNVDEWTAQWAVVDSLVRTGL